MPYIIFITLLLTAASGIFSLYRQLQMLQQNEYSLSRYLKWIKLSYTTELAISAVLYCAITIAMLKGKWIFSFALAAILLVLRVWLNIDTHKKSTKNLLFTRRVKTLYIAAILVLGILLLVSVLLPRGLGAEVCRTLCMVLSIITPLLTFLVWALTYPIEKNYSSQAYKRC